MKGMLLEYSMMRNYWILPHLCHIITDYIIQRTVSIEYNISS